MIELSGIYGKDCKIFTDKVEESAMVTIKSILDDEVSKGARVRIMPDVHDGKGIVIGFTMGLTDRINPNHVGVDIGCGMLCAKIEGLSLSLEYIDKKIRSVVPMGFERSKEVNLDSLSSDTALLCEKIGLNKDDVCSQLGTLGGGNHFIEIGLLGEDMYLTIHSGSRNFGLQVCNYHAKKAKLSGSDYLFGDDMDEYLHDMNIAQKFAYENRIEIFFNIIDAFGVSYSEVFDTIHNYIDMDIRIIRKGAVSAKNGELLLIPMNMRDGSLLCVGKGNKDWNCSAPHGAGRIYSRNRAKKELSLSDFESEMKGVFSTSVCKGTLDESPMAYKSMNDIVENIQDTVNIVGVIKPILNIKSII